MSGRVWLDSASDDDGSGALSVVGEAPIAEWSVVGDRCSLREGGQVIESHAARDVFVSFAQACARYEISWRGDETGRSVALGYFGYECGRATRHDRRGNDLPDAWFGFFDRVTTARGAMAVPWPVGEAPRIGALMCEYEAEYRAGIGAVMEHLRAGDAYQVNLARRLHAPILTSGDPLAWYVAMRTVAPAPFGAVIDMGSDRDCHGQCILSASPERFLTVRGNQIESRPIKGTRRRTGDVVRDAASAADLGAALKDQAEHLMIVDLLRNDIGQVAELGTVAVPALRYVVELPQLYHLVSRITGRLRAEVTLADMLRATLPGGSITGAPKSRVIEIIDALEPVRRGPYCGVLGMFGLGAVNLAMGIRMAVVTNEDVRVHVGGGIVIDSNADAEWQETEDKAAAWRRVLAP